MKRPMSLKMSLKLGRWISLVLKVSNPLPRKVYRLEERVNEVETELDRLDILVQNAGMATRTFRRSSDGWEQTYSARYQD